MSKNWSLILVVAFTLGFGVKAYLDSQHKLAAESTAPLALLGENQQAVQLFDPADPRIRIVYFGFTRCPDVCPTSLAMLSAALNQVDDNAKSQLRPMFISLDPERDDAKLAAQYAHYFHPMIEGASGSIETTQQLAQKYGVIFRKTELPNSELKYTLDHSSYFYFLQPDGTLINKVPHTQDPAPIVDAIQKVIHSKG
ncbi:SCO family protein [Vibrio metoecus]|uniref:Photosynthetic protein synthase I n=1 Tax=Vibrio metoecus TaxID=1481663 RepID=A0ABR4RY09_VIBMT|nr:MULTISPECIES: SCO family protein [Vibrio]EEX64798.1 cytochrome oxidase biogenesis protein Sco1/SenC/PrrC putative copper metallochaperone [Vibrio metoecus]KDO14405.1 photosynthetic protein synthase I [Vibrio metoecus]KQA21096.1 photosynthetic protein synthase I [Vibrio metoecus]KQA27161.1 photosynthetic protein synthase I [Vibrio metoecus]KQA99074.1 photosynthetic protein synthase I [Vibrio metoecus]